MLSTVPIKSNTAATAPTTTLVIPNPPKRPACRARITNPAAPATTSSSASISKAPPASPVSLPSLNAHSAPMQPRGMDAITRANTTNNAPPTIAATPPRLTRFKDDTVSSSVEFRCKPMVTPGRGARITQMSDSSVVSRTSRQRCRT